VVVGTVETRLNSAADFKPIAAAGVIEADTWVRTGPKSKCTIDFPDGSEVRVDESTEVHVQAARKVHLKVGRLFVNATPGAPFFALSEFSAMETAAAKFDLRFRIRGENEPERKKVSRTVTTLAVMEGQLKMPSKRYSQVVTAGYTAELVDAQLNTPDPTPNPTLYTAWVHELLSRPKDDAEVQVRTNAILSELAIVKENDPQEAALLGLGERAAPAVFAYLKIPGTPFQLPRRRAAARVMGETAPAASAGDLAAILKDADADIRVSAAKGLKRLSGQDLGFDEAFWRGAKFADGHKAWTDWLAKNAASLTAPKK
jgi:hypothetical protein